MWERSDKLKLGKSSAFVKKNLRLLPLTEAQFEAGFFLDAGSSAKGQEQWMGLVIEREFGALLAMEDVRWPPPTVNDLANLLAQAMSRPLTGGDLQRPETIHLRDRAQWQELLPHLRQLGIEIVFSDNLPRFDEAVIYWMQHKKKQSLPSVDEIKATLRKPFPERKRTWPTDAAGLMEWTDRMSKGAYPSRKVSVPPYNPMTVVPIQLTAAELEVILTKTHIRKTKKLRPRLQAMATEGKAIELGIHDWSQVLLALCGTREKEKVVCKHLLRIALEIANRLADVLGIDGPLL
jgi:hypothetical protein